MRNDVERLRALGYPVHATRGRWGLPPGGGGTPPPLLLDDEEAVAVVGLAAPGRRGRRAGDRGGLPAGLWPSWSRCSPPASGGVQALQAATVPVPWDRPCPRSSRLS